MKKIPSLFKRNYKGNRQVYNEVVPEAAWVLAGEGRPTMKLDGTCCLVRDGKLFKRYDRKVTRKAKKRGAPFKPEDFKPAPEEWEPCEDEPNVHTGHWPGWHPIGDGPEDRYFREAWENCRTRGLYDGTYELLGPKIQGNPHNLVNHELKRHGMPISDGERSFDALRERLRELPFEGIVWHHPDGRMAKIKRKDFGYPWPKNKEKRQ